MIECIRFTVIEKGSLKGFADLFVQKWGVTLYGCALHEKDGKKWINLPTREGKDEDGERKYFSVIRFNDPNHYYAFSDKAKEAINKFRFEKCSEDAKNELL